MVPFPPQVLTLHVLPVADDAVGRAGLAAMILQSGRVVTTAPATSRQGITATLARERVQALVWDAGDLPSSLELLAHHAEQWPPAVMLVQAAHVREALQSGARGVLGRDPSPQMLGAAVDAVAHGLTVVDPVLLSTLVPVRTEATPIEPLTSRERETLSLMAEGMSNRAIARQLDISEHTAKFHVNAVMAKLGVQRRTEAVTRAVRLGLLIL